MPENERQRWVYESPQEDRKQKIKTLKKKELPVGGKKKNGFFVRFPNKSFNLVRSGIFCFTTPGRCVWTVSVRFELLSWLRIARPLIVVFISGALAISKPHFSRTQRISKSRATFLHSSFTYIAHSRFYLILNLSSAKKGGWRILSRDFDKPFYSVSSLYSSWFH